MKAQTLNKVLISVIIVFLFYNCNSRYPNSVAVNDTICTNYANETISQLNVDLVKAMIKGYRNNQLVHINNGSTPRLTTQIPNNFDDAHSIWFDLKTLKKFIYHIEMNALKNVKKVPIEDLGVRIYYANYPEYETWQNKYPDLNDLRQDAITQKYGLKHTLVMIPTIYRKGDSISGNFDFNPLLSQTYESLSNYTNSLTVPALTVRSIVRGVNSSTTAQNHGSLIPPGNRNSEGF